MSQKILIRDLTLRDGQQSLLATRMTQEQVERVLPFYREANFYAMEVWGGAVPDSVMRYLKEDPWERLEKIKEFIGDRSKLTALSRGRNLFGYNPYPDEVIEGFCRNSVRSGVDIMRIFDALNDTDNLVYSIKVVKKNGGIADGAVCFTVDPKLPPKKLLFGLVSKQQHFEPVFTTEYFVQKAKVIESLGADMITIKDMAGLITPARTRELIRALKKNVSIPVDFHTHCTPGFGLASMLTAILSGVDIIDTCIWYFAGGPAAPAIEIMYVFCKKLNIELDVNFDAIRHINKELLQIRKELREYDTYDSYPRSFDVLKDTLPVEIERLFDDAIDAAQKMDEKQLLHACHAIEAWFGFPPPEEKVRQAEIPGGMYTNMLAQLKQLNLEHLFDRVLEIVPYVRIDAGCPPLVTPTSQIVGVQAVNCAIDENKGLPWYTTKNTQFINLVKGHYGKTPIPVKPEFRKKISGSEIEEPYDTAGYQKQPNPVFPEFGNKKLARTEKEELLLELFPNVADAFLKHKLEQEYRKEQEEERLKAEEEYLKEKIKYNSMSEEQKKQRLLEGLYNYRWVSYLDVDDEQNQQINNGSGAEKQKEISD